MLKIALIGGGKHSQESHAPALARYAKDFPGKLELVAVCDLNHARADFVAKEFGFKKSYNNHHEMIRKEQLDGCVCVMPIPLIVPLAIELSELGMPVSIEKPPGASIDEAYELETVLKRTGTPHMISMNRRFQPLVREGRDWALAHGPARFVRACMLRHERTEKHFVSATGIHSVDVLRFFAGDVSSFESFIQQGGTLWHHHVLQFESDILGVFDAMTTSGLTEEYYEIIGEGYSVQMWVEGSREPRLKCWLDGELLVDKKPDPEEPDFVRLGSYCETHEFISALFEKRAMSPSMADILPSLELAYQMNS